MTSPAVVIKTQYTTATTSSSSGSSFNKFVNYIDRNNTRANNNEFADYQNYMSNEEKSTGLFTNELDSLSEADKSNVKAVIRKAQANKSVMWQDVISFDNSWLKEMGVLKEGEGGQFIDEKKLKQATRNAVNAMWKNEGINDSIYWTAAIHYNTDNIHVHVASVQTRDFRWRGKRKQKSLDKMKSSVVNTIMDRSKENAKLNDFIRNKVVLSKKNDDTLSLKNRLFEREIVQQFKKIYSMLPSDKRTWMYSMNAMKDIRPEIDKLTTLYIEKHYPKEFEQFKKDLDKEVKVLKKTYGNDSRAETYRKTKMDDLYKRMGNTILKEMKEHDKKINQASLQKRLQNANRKKLNFERNVALNRLAYAVGREMRYDVQHYKNQREFEQLQYESELNKR